MSETTTAPKPRWTALEEGCVRDNILHTRLDGSQFYREWTPFLATEYTHYELEEKGEQIAAECKLLGGGWKVPDPHELVSTINYAKYEPAMDEEIADGRTGGWVWTSQKEPSDSSCAFFVGLYGGYVYWNLRDGSGLVRLCREVSPRQ
ncbi:MAG TPA: DUF1566 domain-containing protein [Nevskia sp.]|nr:DUF1566 domain-containing protein [Nevskia sp.]